MFPSSESPGGSFLHAAQPHNMQNSYWGGYTPSPLSPDLPMPLPEGSFTDSMTPHLQVVKLISERDTLKYVFAYSVYPLIWYNYILGRCFNISQVLFGSFKKTRSTSTVPSFPQFQQLLTGQLASPIQRFSFGPRQLLRMAGFTWRPSSWPRENALSWGWEWWSTYRPDSQGYSKQRRRIYLQCLSYCSQSKFDCQIRCKFVVY